MKNIKFFDIDYGKVKTIVLDLIKAVPVSWLCSCGVLRAHWIMVSSGEVCSTAGYLIENGTSARIVQFKDLNPMPEREMNPDDLRSLIEHRKLPHSICFSNFDHPRTLPETIKNIAPFYIERDYTGGLFFYKHLDEEEQGPAGIFIVSRLGWYGRVSTLGDLPRESVSGAEIAKKNGEFPDTYNPIVKIVWYDQYGGGSGDVEELVAVCETYKLRERTLQEILPFVTV